MTKVIALASAKGGVGKTTTAINLGTALAGFGRPALVFDANLKTPNIGIHLGAPIVPASVHDALSGKKSIRSCIYSHQSGLKIVPGSISLADSKLAKPEIIGTVIKELEGTSEIIILDSASGIGNDAFSAMAAADEVIVVTTPDLPSVTDTLKTIKLADEKGITVVGAVINRARNDKLELTAGEVEGMLDVPVIASIPEDNSIREALKKNHPVVYIHPDSASSIEYKKLAAMIIGQKYEILAKKGVGK